MFDSLPSNSADLFSGDLSSQCTNNHINESINEQIEIASEYRWQIYQRLQELEIPCEYRMYTPLKVQIDHPVQALQLWSVLQSLVMSRQALVERLETYWNLQVV